MASLEDSLIASAMEALDIEEYWPTFDGNQTLETDDDGEYSIILYFYEYLLDHLMKTRYVEPEHVQQAISYLVKNYARNSNGKTPSDLDYNSLSNCIGYLHRYAACHTALVHTVMLKMFHINPPIVIRRMLALKDHLNIMSVGSGPGNDLVGLLSALYGRHYGFLGLDICVVDKMFGWRAIFVEIEKHLRKGLCGNASKLINEVEVNSSFIEADLKVSSSWSAEFKQKMFNADIITLVKFLSAVPKGHREIILKNIVLSMKPGSVIIVIDCPFPTEEFAALSNYLDTVYEATKEKFDFNFQVERFGFTNIIASKAFVRVYVRKFILTDTRSS